MPKRRGFWNVMIFDTPDSMNLYSRSKHMPGGRYLMTKYAIGFCRALETYSYRGGYRPSPRGLRGVVMFALNKLGVRVASHEWTHAAHYELSSHQGRTKLTLKDDERLAYLQCDLHAAFWRLFHKRFRQTDKYARGFPVWKMRTA